MDRNSNHTNHMQQCVVALRKESVDRNAVAHMPNAVRAGSLSARRAWIEICRQGIFAQTFGKSLSARRAWIEIIKLGNSAMIGGVALRKESVDRNREGYKIKEKDRQSLSARRAWIEITHQYTRRPP